jgi:hypothetical protein
MLAMSERKTHGDEYLFVLALAASLVGLGLLLRTTGIARGFRTAWPLAVLAAGGLLLFFSVVRKSRSMVFFAAGIFFAVFGAAFLVASLFGWHFSEAWPLIMVAAGLAWLLSGLRHFRRMKAGYFAPALGFMVLGALFCLFSFDLVGMSFGRFVIVWWPSFLILGGLVLFAVYFITRRTGLPGDGAGEDEAAGDDVITGGE